MQRFGGCRKPRNRLMNSCHKPHCIQHNVSLKNSTYYRMGGVAQNFASPCTNAELLQCIKWAQSEKTPIAILGSGSNSVYSDCLFEGLIVTLAELRQWHWEDDSTLVAQGGVTNTEIAEAALEKGYSDAAWMYRMPGQLGASIRMNARCYGGETSQIVCSAQTLDMFGNLNHFEASEIFKGYKSTRFMDAPEIVIGARLKFKITEDFNLILNKMEQCESDRHTKHHFQFPSCGSTFKNNYAVGKPSGKVFDELNLKGTKIGNAEISQFHANFVWNLGNALSHDMLTLAAFMKKQALTISNAPLELEVQPVGVFSHDLFQSCGMSALGPHYTYNSENSQWVGLAWHPESLHNSDNQTKVDIKIFNPISLVSSPFTKYTKNSNSKEFNAVFELTQLQSINNAQNKVTEPFLKWTTKSNANLLSDFNLLCPHQADSFVDMLWNFSVSELFLAHPQNPHSNYLEFEMTPQKHWVAIAFEGIRKRKAAHLIPHADIWSGTNRFSNDQKFGMTLSYDQIRDVISTENTILVQGCASLGNGRLYLAPHWGFSDEQPNFHQPERFWVAQLQ